MENIEQENTQEVEDEIAKLERQYRETIERENK